LSSGWIAIDDATIEVGLDDAENRGIEERLVWRWACHSLLEDTAA
jgi:hypothetical protein